jgi:hypothetical protein
LTAGVLLALSTVAALLIEFRVLEIQYAYWGDIFINGAEWCILYVRWGHRV